MIVDWVDFESEILTDLDIMVYLLTTDFEWAIIQKNV